MPTFLPNTAVLISLSLSVWGVGQVNYLDYHTEIIECEELIADQQFPVAIERYEELFTHYDFVFLRDIQVATELCAYNKQQLKGLDFIRLGIQHGWTLKALKKNKRLAGFRQSAEWSDLMLDYDSLHALYLKRINQPLRERVHQLFKVDQKKALGALLRFSEKSRTRYAEEQFAPHSERQLQELDQIMQVHGYPGEQLIGNDLWGSVILSHHNSISVSYNTTDTLYTYLRPQLLNALEEGQLSHYEFAQMEDWKTAGLSGHSETEYGFLGAMKDETSLALVNANRAEIGMRSIALRNRLIDIEEQTGMDLRLPKGWQNGKILPQHSKGR